MLLGGHCSGGIKKALENAHAFGMDSVQLFAQSPRTWRFPEHDPADLEAFRARREELGIGAVSIHALYLLNLASPKDDFYEKSVATLRSTVDTACAIGAESVVFHVGSHLGSGFEAGLERVVPALSEALERCSETTWLCMENAAGTGDTVGRSLDELAAIYDAVGRHERLGVCLDSCHLFASGYDVTKPAVLDDLLGQLDREIGLERLRCLHVNDSKTPLGSNRDRHENIGDGLIGDKLTVFLGHPKLQGLPALLEVPGDGHGPDAEQMAKLREAPRASYEAIRAKTRNDGCADRQLVELRVDAAELVGPALVARLDLDPAHRQRRRGRAARPRSRRAALGRAQQVEIDLDREDLHQAAHVRVAELLVRVEERARALEHAAG